MKKKLLALAVAGAFVAPVAMADTANVQIYGAANVSFDSTDNNPNGGNGTRASKVSSNGSHIGFKGSESLGGGTSAIWQIETAVGVDNSGATGQGFGTRNTFAGLKGEGWGSLVLGRTDNAYKAATRRLDLFDETLGDNRSLLGSTATDTAGVMTGFDARNSDSANYTSPNMSGFSAAVTVLAGAEGATTGAQKKGTGYALAGMYDAGPVYATLAYASLKSGDAPGTLLNTTTGIALDKTSTAWKLGGGYKVDQFAVNAVFERFRDENGGGIGNCAGVAAGSDCMGHNTFYLAGQYNVTASDAVKLAYARAGNVKAASNTSARQITVGYDHAMSKRTSVYALYTKLRNDTLASYGIAGGEIESTGVVAGVANSSPSALSLGMKHTF